MTPGDPPPAPLIHRFPGGSAYEKEPRTDSTQPGSGIWPKDPSRIHFTKLCNHPWRQFLLSYRQLLPDESKIWPAGEAGPGGTSGSPRTAPLTTSSAPVPQLGVPGEEAEGRRQLPCLAVVRWSQCSRLRGPLHRLRGQMPPKPFTNRNVCIFLLKYPGILTSGLRTVTGKANPASSAQTLPWKLARVWPSRPGHPREPAR